MSIYISGALKGSSNLAIARRKYELVAECLVGLGLQPYVPHCTTDPVKNSDILPKDVYVADANAIELATSAIIFLDEPSLGVGLEIALFVGRKIPILALCEEGISPSRFAVGFLNTAGISLTPYDTNPVAEVRKWAKEELFPVAA